VNAVATPTAAGPVTAAPNFTAPAPRKPPLLAAPGSTPTRTWRPGAPTAIAATAAPDSL